MDWRECKGWEKQFIRRWFNRGEEEKSEHLQQQARKARIAIFNSKQFDSNLHKKIILQIEFEHLSIVSASKTQKKTHATHQQEAQEV